MEYSIRQFELDIVKRYDLFDSIFGQEATKNNIDMQISLIKTISIACFYSVIPSNEIDARRNLKSAISEVLPMALTPNSRERIKIIGPIKKYHFIPLVIKATDIPFVQRLPSERRLIYTENLVPIKMFVCPKEDSELIKRYSAFSSNFIQSFYAFNCFRLSDRNIDESSIWIAEVSSEVGESIMKWQSKSGISLTKSNSPAINIEYEIKSNSTMDALLKFETDPCPLTQIEAKILKRTGLFDEDHIPVSKRGYINTDQKYRQSEFQRYKSHYSSLIEKKHCYGVEDTNSFFVHERRRLSER